MPVTAKTESVQTKAEPKSEGEPDNGEGEPDNGEGMDAYARAALETMGKRNIKRKAEQAAKQADKAAEKKMHAQKGAATIKKPTGLVKTEGVKKEVKVESVSKANILKAMPKTASNGNPSPVHYGGGVIYTVQHQHKFRCLRVRGDRYSEKAVTWGHSKPKKDAWKECIAAIDQKNTKAE